MSAIHTITARRIDVGYDRRAILKGVDFEAAPGSFTVLVGPNGCGKSTLLKALCRVLPLMAGSVTLAGRDVHRGKTSEIARTLAFLPQGPIAPEGLTVGELVAQGRFPHQNLLRQWSADDAQAVSRVLQQTDLTDLEHRPVHSLSGGQRQRAWIAMVLAQDTPVLLLDEPTAFLDLKVQIELLSLLRRIAHDENRTVVTVLHDLNVAASFADRMVMLRDGHIHADGPVDQVFTADNLMAVFDLRASILVDPTSGRPVCLPVTDVPSIGGE